MSVEFLFFSEGRKQRFCNRKTKPLLNTWFIYSFPKKSQTAVVSFLFLYTELDFRMLYHKLKGALNYHIQSLGCLLFFIFMGMGRHHTGRRQRIQQGPICWAFVLKLHTTSACSAMMCSWFQRGDLVCVWNLIIVLQIANFVASAYFSSTVYWNSAKWLVCCFFAQRGASLFLLHSIRKISPVAFFLTF